MKLKFSRGGPTGIGNGVDNPFSRNKDPKVYSTEAGEKGKMKLLRFVEGKLSQKGFGLAPQLFFCKSPLNSKLLSVVSLYMRGGIIHK